VTSGEPHGPIALIAHGSRDPRSAETMRALATAAGAAWPQPVVASFLDFNPPSVPDSLRELWRRVGTAPIVVPALLTSAYHGRVDVPEVLRDSGVPTRLTRVLGPSEPGDPVNAVLLRALRSRLSGLDVAFDGLVLIAAGTSYAAARSTVDSVAATLSEETHVPCVVGYASASGPTGADAVRAVRACGAERIAVSSYFLAPGRLHDSAVASARSAGVVGVAEPLGVAVADLVLARAAETSSITRFA
jgi:sirohydrochlorin ferrochelatase